MDAAAYLAATDSYRLFEQLDDLIKTGPTGTNVMDVRVILISRAPTENLAGMMNEQVRRHVPDAHFDPATWERFGARLSHLVVDGRGDHGWDDLAKALAGR